MSLKAADMEFVRIKVIEVIQFYLDLPPGSLKETDHFINDLGADSLDLVEVVVELEKHFDVTFSDEDCENIETVGDAIRYSIQYVEANMNNAA